MTEEPKTSLSTAKQIDIKDSLALCELVVDLNTETIAVRNDPLALEQLAGRYYDDMMEAKRLQLDHLFQRYKTAYNYATTIERMIYARMPKPLRSKSGKY